MMHRHFDLNGYNTKIHMYGLNQMLNSPYKTWEGRDNIDIADIAVKLSFINMSRKFTCLDILISLTDIFLRRSYKAVVDWLPCDFGDTNSWKFAEVGRVNVVKFLVHLLDEWYTKHGYSDDTPDCPCEISVTYRDEKCHSQTFFRVEDFVKYLTRERLWIYTDRIRIKMGERDIFGKIDYDTHDLNKQRIY